MKILYPLGQENPDPRSLNKSLFGNTVEHLNSSGIDEKIRQVSSTTGTLHYLQDHLGSTLALTDASGDVVEQISYDSFGNSEGSAYTRYTYTGREWDGDAGLYYYRARFYDAQAGRFISEDPIGFAGGVNFYAYVDDNPVNLIDPSGLYGEAIYQYRYRLFARTPNTENIFNDPVRQSWDYLHDKYIATGPEDYRFFRPTRIYRDISWARICHNPERTGTPPNGWPLGYAVGDDRGHIIAAELGGSGDKYFTFGQDPWMNQRSNGPWRSFERQIRDHIDRNQCECADLRVELFYDNATPLRPTHIQYDVNFTGGTQMHGSFPNRWNPWGQLFGAP